MTAMIKGVALLLCGWCATTTCALIPNGDPPTKTAPQSDLGIESGVDLHHHRLGDTGAGSGTGVHPAGTEKVTDPDEAFRPTRVGSTQPGVLPFAPSVGAGAATHGHPVTSTFPSTTITTATAVGLAAVCPALAACRADVSCAPCLTAVLPYATGLSRLTKADFLMRLVQTPSCASPTSPTLLYNVFFEFFTTVGRPCAAAAGLTDGDVPKCQVAISGCFSVDGCRRCLERVTTPETNGEWLRSPSCSEPNTTRGMMALGSACGDFGHCTSSKLRCEELEECTSCLNTLRRGDGVAAAQQCSAATGPAWATINIVVAACDVGPTACAFQQENCRMNDQCNSCLSAMDYGRNLDAIARGGTTLACAATLSDAALWGLVTSVLLACTPADIADCRLEATACVLLNATCALCINGSLPKDSDVCAALLVSKSQNFRYNVPAVCITCPDWVDTVNWVVLATTIIGGASIVGCLGVILTILAHSRDRISTRDRIVIGLMLANMVYSSANVIPTNKVGTASTNCGQLVLSFDTIKIGRAVWFVGKYGLVSYEVFILAVSVWAIAHGTRSISYRSEAVLHCACILVCVAAFVAFYVTCTRINDDGFNVSNQEVVVDHYFNHLSSTDDADGDAVPEIDAAKGKLDRGRDEYDLLVQRMLQLWSGAVGVAIIVWIGVRIAYAQISLTWRACIDAVNSAELADAWGDTRRSEWRAKSTLLNAQLAAYTAVAKPMEPYLVVFVVFAVPAIVMSTTTCHDNSRVSVESSFIEYGTCDLWCEFTLAWRSLATVAVYLLPRPRRVEFFSVRRSVRLLFARVAGRRNALPRGENDLLLLEMSAIAPAIANRDHIPIVTASIACARTTPSEAWAIAESDVEVYTLIGAGTFAEVWTGRWLDRPVAVKVMRARSLLSNARHDDSTVDPTADKDLWRECQQLQQLDHPNLITFYGYGTAEDGRGFIVTELMSLGSLDMVLHDPVHELPWPARVSIALQIALGVEHLHNKLTIHRDLKSANVLISHGDQWVAKVSDFGTSTQLRPQTSHVLFSAFTGALQVVQRVGQDSVATSTEVVLTPALIRVGVCNANGTLTQASGTLLWMAPEAFRGDCSCGSAVDVFSFGLILWEIATRRTPWDELGAAPRYAELVDQLTVALQTGRRPAVPAFVQAAHPDYVVLMQICWVGDPSGRPCFAEITSALALCLRQLRASDR
eukprot:m.82503 g.82503  ORF g.82503 m.82503 type:complete len:1195 (+) comp19552_c0_seq1:104-3688(+)